MQSIFILPLFIYHDDCNHATGIFAALQQIQKIRESGLWLVNGLYKEGLSLAELDELKRVVQGNPALSRPDFGDG